MEDMRGTVTVNRMCSLGRNGSLMDAPDCTWHRKMHRHPRGTTARLKKKNAGECDQLSIEFVI